MKKNHEYTRLTKARVCTVKTQFERSQSPNTEYETEET